MKKLNVEVMSTNKLKVAVDSIVKSETSKSKKMIALFELGLTIKEIATIMDTRYNFVYNVVSNYSNVNGIERETSKKGGTKEKIVELYKQGKSNKEISIDLKTNINYVYNVLKQHKLSNTNAAEEEIAE